MSTSTTLHIKNMVCPRCIMVVEQLFQRLQIPTTSIALGEVVLPRALTTGEYETVEYELEMMGFAFVGDRRARLVEDIRKGVLTYVTDAPLMHRMKLSDYLADFLHTNYAALSQAFSSSRGITIERYCILQKIERVKELLTYDELTISEIAFQLNYSSAAHLSAQFKTITGMSPRAFKAMGIRHRLPLDQV